MPAPVIDGRSTPALADKVRELLRRYTGRSPVPGGTDPGEALVSIFAHLAERVIDRLNRVPDRNFLAFLDLLGIELLPPQAARVPVTFSLAEGTTGPRMVPFRTPIAGVPLEGEEQPVIFETERALVVTPYQLTDALSRDPDRDRWADHTLAATGALETDFPAFEGERPIAHHLYLSHPVLRLPEAKRVTLGITSPADSGRWPQQVAWSYYAQGEWHPLTASAQLSAGARWTVTLEDVPHVPAEEVAERASSWLRGHFLLPLREQEALPERAFSDHIPLDLSRVLYPFGRLEPHSTFYLAAAVLSQLGGLDAWVEIHLALDEEQPPEPSPNLQIDWEFWDGTDWRELGASSPATASIGTEAYGFDDGTRAFTASGVLRFRPPEEWHEGSVHEVAGWWLRARIADGGFSTLARFRPPAVRHLTLGYEIEPPEIRRLDLSATIHEENVPLPAAFANLVAVDLSKDFLPFGEHPRLGDTLYLALPALGDKRGATATLSLSLTPGGGSAKLVLRWEFWNAPEQRWDLLGESGPGAEQSPPEQFQDHTQGLTATGAGVNAGRVRIGSLPALGVVEVNGRRDHWIRVRIAGGDYGQAARYTPVLNPDGTVVTHPNTRIPMYQLQPADFQPPIIHSLSLEYNYESSAAPAQHVLAENDFRVLDHTEAAAAPGAAFHPFLIPGSEFGPTLYLGFRRQGVEPGREPGFANQAVALYLAVADVPYMADGEGGRTPAGPPDVVWEYWSPNGWTRMGVRDETVGFTRRGVLSFIGPPDFFPSPDFGRTAYWLRARLERGAFASPPRLRRVLLNTVWAVHRLTLENEVLGSSTGERSQVFHTSRIPVLPGQWLEVREREIPSSAERARITDEEGATAVRTLVDAPGRATEVWVRWHEVIDFYGSGPRSRHYMLDRLTGEIRFGDGQYGMVPPQGRSNLVMRLYHTGGGPQGNRPAGNVNELRTTIPNVQQVTNWEPAGGGTPGETLDAVRVRGPRSLRHRDRAVTTADYEDLAMEASPGIARVRGIAATSAESAGRVVLLVVPRSTASQPIPSLELLRRVEDHLRGRAAATVELVVRGPQWLRVTVSLEVVPTTAEQANEVRTAVMAALDAFLHPLSGGTGGTGWEFGRKPYRSDLYALVESVPGVDHVRRLRVEETGNAEHEHFLVFSGPHDVQVSSLVEV